MSTLHIEHAITDFATWSAAFARFAEARSNAGVRAERILRPTGDDYYVMVQLDFETCDAAVVFKDFLTTVVWTSADNAPGLAGAPRAVVLDQHAPGAQHSCRSTPRGSSSIAPSGASAPNACGVLSAVVERDDER